MLSCSHRKANSCSCQIEFAVGGDAKRVSYTPCFSEFGSVRILTPQVGACIPTSVIPSFYKGLGGW